MAELRRRDLSGIYIFDIFPGEEKRQPTCIEDCQPETRRQLLMTMSKEWMRDCIKQLAQTFMETTDFLVNEGCLTDEQRKELFILMDRGVKQSQWNWAEHELADQVDFFCEKLTILADACGVTKHKEIDKDGNTILDSKILDHYFSVRSLAFMKANGIVTVRDLVRHHKTDLLRFRNFGKQSFAELDDFVKSNGLEWGMEV